MYFYFFLFLFPALISVLLFAKEMRFDFISLKKWKFHFYNFIFTISFFSNIWLFCQIFILLYLFFILFLISSCFLIYICKIKLSLKNFQNFQTFKICYISFKKYFFHLDFVCLFVILFFSVNTFLQRENVYLEKIQGEFDVTEKVKRKKGNHIPSRRFF